MKLYDAMDFLDKPPSEELGCTHFPGIMQYALHGGADEPNKNHSKPSWKWYPHHARKMQEQGETTAYLNLEKWQIDMRKDSPATAERKMQNKLATLALFRIEAPAVRWQAFNWQVDFHAMHWRIAIDDVKLDQWWKWHAWNERYAAPVLRAQHSIFMGCSYLRKAYNDDRYKRLTRTFYCEIRRLCDKPIYPFVRFRYGTKNMTWIPPERLRMSLEHLKDLGVDGFVLWSYGKKYSPEPWNTPELQELWQVVQDVTGGDDG